MRHSKFVYLYNVFIIISITIHFTEFFQQFFNFHSVDLTIIIVVHSSYSNNGVNSLTVLGVVFNSVLIPLGLIKK
jgi:hypothetical protein